MAPDKTQESANNSRQPGKTSLIARLWFTFLLFLMLFAGLCFFIIFQMTEIANLNELTFHHPFTVSNAVLRVQMNIEKIRNMMYEFHDAEYSRQRELQAGIHILERIIDEDFAVIQQRFLGDPRRLKEAVDKYESWKEYRNSEFQRYFSQNGAAMEISANPLQLSFSGEMDYLSAFANAKALEFLSESRLNARTSITSAYILAVCFLIFGVISVYSMVQSIRNPLKTLLASVEEVQRGNYSQQIHIVSGGGEFIRLAHAVNSMTLMLRDKNQMLEANIAERTKKLEHSLEERNTLIRELYHRTKNNMQVISSMIALKAEEMDETQAQQAMLDMERKIQAMALVHQMLYQSEDISHINLDEYANNLANLVLGAFSHSTTEVTYAGELEHVPLLIDFAIPFGLVLNELLTNSLKYAFVDRSHGSVWLKGASLPHGGIFIEYRDDGVGLPPGTTLETSGSMGFVLIKTIVEHQLKGSIRLVSDTGFHCRLDFDQMPFTSRI